MKYEFWGAWYHIAYAQDGEKIHSVKYMQYCTWMITKHCTCILQIYDKFQPIFKYGISDLLMNNEYL